MFPLRSGALPECNVKSVIFITRPNLKYMDYISENIHAEQKKKSATKKEFYLFFVPRKSELCVKHLITKGVYGSFEVVGHFPCNLFPIENDLLSLELEESYKELYLEGDPTVIHQSAEALIDLQKLYGRIPRISGIGNYSRQLWEQTKSMGQEDVTMFNSDKGSIDHLVIFDRSIDLMSVLASQLTYEGLIDDIFRINCTTAKFPSEKFTNTDPQQGTTSTEKKIILNSSDELYTELRDKHYYEVVDIIPRFAKTISSQFGENYDNKSIQELKKFVEKLPGMLASRQSLATHTAIAELIKEVINSDDLRDEFNCEQEFMICSDVDKPSPFIEDMMAKKAPLRNVLRLMCLQCIAGSGFKPKVLDYYKRELVQVYGIETLLTIGNLEKAQLLRVQTGARSYAVLRKTLNLTTEEDFVVNKPKDIFFVHHCYAPLSIRIIEKLLKPNGLKNLTDVQSCLSGPIFEDFQPQLNSNGRRGSLSSELSQSESVFPVILIFFLGGCTFAEIAALRFLAKQEENNFEFVIATTKLINKNTFLDRFIEN